jgi:hypothetical protein
MLLNNKSFKESKSIITTIESKIDFIYANIKLELKHKHITFNNNISEIDKNTEICLMTHADS